MNRSTASPAIGETSSFAAWASARKSLSCASAANPAFNATNRSGGMPATLPQTRRAPLGARSTSIATSWLGQQRQTKERRKAQQKVELQDLYRQFHSKCLEILCRR